MKHTITLIAILTMVAGSAGAAPGDLDPSFGTSGKVIGPSGRATSVAVQTDGKLVAVGSTPVDSLDRLSIARFDQDGSPDQSFGSGGYVTTNVLTGWSGVAKSVAIQSDGKIVVAGHAHLFPDNWGRLVVVRYNTDGSLDSSFDGDGIATTTFGTGWVEGGKVVIQPDGKILVSGRSDFLLYDAPYFAVVRYNQNGSLDMSFGGGDGVANVDLFSVEDATSISLQPDGKIVGAGYSYGFFDYLAVVRLTPDGSLDTTFEGDGIVYTDIGPAGDLGLSIAVQSDGKIVAGGHSSNGSTNQFALVRYTSNGSLDTTFDGDGKLTTPIGSNGIATSVALQPDGRILAAGGTGSANSDFALARYNSDGSLDQSFGGGDGISTVDFGGPYDHAYGVVLDARQNALVVGESGGNSAIGRFTLGISSAITVTNTNDSGPGSLRQAIADAAPGDTINFSVTGTITLTSGALVIDKNLTIQGPGAHLLSVSGNHTSVVFRIVGVSAELNGMTIKNGLDFGIISTTWNGQYATLRIGNSTVTHNLGAGISNTAGSLVVHDSTISNNARSGIQADAACFFPPYVSVSNGTISGNGGIGVVNYDGTADITDSTLVGNRGGIFSMDDCQGEGGNTRLVNTIVAGNIRYSDLYFSGTDIFGKEIAVASHNLIGDAAYSGGVQNGVNGNIVGLNPLLGPLRNNGGPTLTHALLVGSPAINAGDNCVLTSNGCGYTHPALTNDQRGMPRNGAVDIGAFERQQMETDSSTLFDFDGDAKADVSVYRNGEWFVYGSQTGFMPANWGNATDEVTAADFDGDGKTDYGVFRDGMWLTYQSSGAVTEVPWGAAGDTPVPGDYDGDGRADQAIFRDGTWWIYRSTEGPIGVQWGVGTDIPVPADYDGDGKTDVAVVRDGTWWIYQSTAGPSGIAWGQAGDKPVPADYDGDGSADVAIIRNGTWWIYQSTLGPRGIAWGNGTDIPVPADYDGDGKSDVAIFREGTWWIYQSTLGATGVPWGNASDIPVPRR